MSHYLIGIGIGSVVGIITGCIYIYNEPQKTMEYCVRLKRKLLNSKLKNENDCQYTQNEINEFKKISNGILSNFIESININDKIVESTNINNYDIPDIQNHDKKCLQLQTILNTLHKDDILTIKYKYNCEKTYILKCKIIDETLISVEELFYNIQDVVLYCGIQSNFDEKYEIYSGPKRNFYSDIKGILISPNVLGFENIEINTDFDNYIFSGDEKVSFEF